MPMPAAPQAQPDTKHGRAGELVLNEGAAACQARGAKSHRRLVPQYREADSLFCSSDMTPGYNTTLGLRWLEAGGVIIFVRSDYSDTISSITDATCVVMDLVTNGVTIPSRIAALGAFEHGAALMEMYPVSEGIFAAFGSYNPRWSSAEPFRGAGRHIQRHKGAQEHHLLVGCNSLSDPLDTYRARRLGGKLQEFEYRVNYYESGMDGSGGLEESDFLLTLQLEFFSQKLRWIRETVPALPNVST